MFGLHRLSVACVAATALAVAACGGETSTAPPVATPTVTLSHDRAPAGSPLTITYKFVVANDAQFAENYRVFAHVVDIDQEQLWTDDHDPPTPTTAWKPGETIEYSRTIFVPFFPYAGDATILLGLHSTKDQKRLPLTGDDAGQLSYRVAHFELLPQTDNLLTVFKDGWHPTEAASPGSPIEWQWTKKQATLAFRNPKKDATLYLEVDSPDKQLHPVQQVQVVLGGQSVDQFPVPQEERTLHTVKLPAALMGDGELAELQIVVDNTFVPAVVAGGASKDPRELGIRVFHAYVDNR